MINKGDYVLGIWISPLTHGWDWVAYVVRVKDAPDFEFHYRHRHNEPSDPFMKEENGKRWIRVKLEGAAEASLLEAVDRFVAETGLRHVARILVRGDVDAMKSALAGRSWAERHSSAPSAL